MNNETDDIHIAPSCDYANTYFIFRDKGIEVKVVIKNNIVYLDKQLTLRECNYIRDNILKIGYKPTNITKRADLKG